MRDVRALGLAGLMLLGACTWWLSGRPDAVEVDQLLFSHQVHVSDFGLACEECHNGVSEAVDLLSPHHPTESVCLDCHDREADCQICHTNPENRMALLVRDAEIGFSHRDHLEMAGSDCGRCHTDAASSTVLPLSAPDHGVCLSCHEHQLDYDRGECTLCHTSMQRLPLVAVAEFEHGPGWMTEHGLLAATDATACLSCHVETSCTECHGDVTPGLAARLTPDAVDRTLLHRGDFRTSHAIEARADADLCLRCHGDNNDFCQDCHTDALLTERSLEPRNPHPPGWSGPNGHGPAARLHPANCASCHDQGPSSNCVDCHQVGRIGGNPHPSGWNSRHALSDVRSDPMCRYCHSP